MNFFLKEVWKTSKTASVIFGLFILGTIYCTFSKIEVTPFFLWAHYSDQQTQTGKFERIYIKVNGEIVDLPKLARPTREMIQLPTEYFVQLEQSNYETGTRSILRKYFRHHFSEETFRNIETKLVNNETDKAAYLDWLIRYLERVYGEKIHELEVGKCQLVFQKDGSVRREKMMQIAKTVRL